MAIGESELISNGFNLDIGLCDGNSKNVFQFQLVTSLPDVLKQLTKSANVQQILNKFAESKSQLILDRLAEATSFLIHHQFTGFPELYADVEPWIAKSKLKDKPLTPERIEGTS